MISVEATEIFMLIFGSMTDHEVVLTPGVKHDFFRLDSCDVNEVWYQDPRTTSSSNEPR